MNYISDENMKKNWTDRECLSSWVLEFSYEKNDYFLNYRMLWKEVTGETYRFNIGNEIVEIPSGFYVMIGDVYGETDWISSDELIGRKADIVVLSKDLETWTLKQAKFLSTGNSPVFWPKTKNIIPMISGENVLIMSDKDVYTKTSEIGIDDFIV